MNVDELSTTLDEAIALIKKLREENLRLKKHIDAMSCCCAGCTKHNQDLNATTESKDLFFKGDGFTNC